MTIFTTVPDNVLEPGDPIRSVDIIAIKDNTIFSYEGMSYEILNTQTFTSSGTWTKPGTGIDPATDSAILILVGGGGSGGAVRTGNEELQLYGIATGGGCAIAISSVPISFLSSTATVTIGAGGAAVSQTSSAGAKNGNAGGTTSIGSITKPGGGAGNSRLSGTAGTLTGGSAVNAINNSLRVFGFSRAGRGGASDTTTFTQPEYSGGGSNGNFDSIQRTQNRTAGPAKVFSFVTLGAGGNGAQTTGGTGANPGGGGGGATNRNANATSGAGGIGWARIFVVRGSPEPADFYERKLA